MIPGKKSPASLVAIGVAVLSISASHCASAQERDAVRIGDTDLGGVVNGAQGPEAGVWVIAETTDLPTRFAAEVRNSPNSLGMVRVPIVPSAWQDRQPVD
jgi:hypothetical protein